MRGGIPPEYEYSGDPQSTGPCSRPEVLSQGEPTPLTLQATTWGRCYRDLVGGAGRCGNTSSVHKGPQTTKVA